MKKEAARISETFIMTAFQNDFTVNMKYYEKSSAFTNKRSR
jgi:hypothetical protein